MDRQEERWRVARRGKVEGGHTHTHTHTHTQLTTTPPFIMDHVCCRTVSDSERKDVEEHPIWPPSCV